MNIVRVGALDVPEEMKSQWAREHLGSAIEKQLSPIPLPSHKVKSFTVPLPAHIAEHIKRISESAGVSFTVAAAGLIEANIKHLEKADTENVPGADEPSLPANIIGADRVRPLLHPLLCGAAEGIEKGEIVFAEAATGTGKGRMIASLAATRAAQGDSVVISAPLAVTWQLLDDLEEIQEARTAGFSLVLGRANFVSPEALQEWANEEDHKEILAWIKGGGRPLSPRAVKASSLVGSPLCWLLEDALSLAEDLPVTSVMLSADAEEDCKANKVYRALRNMRSEKGIVLCSHHMLAAHVWQAQLRKLEHGEDDLSSPLPLVIDTLIVDEAHLLETAFASIYSHSLRLRPLVKRVKNEVSIGRKALLQALDDLSAYIEERVTMPKGTEMQFLSEANGIQPVLQNLEVALRGAKIDKKKKKASSLKIQLNQTLDAVQAALTGTMALRFEVSPIKKYPRLIVGRANLEKAILWLWDQVVGAALVSATLYSDGVNAKLARWKLAIPTERANYLPSIHPEWVTSSVTLHSDRIDLEPGKSVEWTETLAERSLEIIENAKGGTLILCTSYRDAEDLALRLEPHLGVRLLTQSATVSATTCANQFRALHQKRIKPVWVGVGAAWTGVNLSDQDVPAEKDYLLTDLVITRLPMGCNRSLTHERREKIAGFAIAVQEAAWMMRQGIGRLVRREGLTDRHLWVLDNRIDEPKNWVSAFRRILKPYER